MFPEYKELSKKELDQEKIKLKEQNMSIIKEIKKLNKILKKGLAIWIFIIPFFGLLIYQALLHKRTEINEDLMSEIGKKKYDLSVNDLKIMYITSLKEKKK